MTRSSSQMGLCIKTFVSLAEANKIKELAGAEIRCGLSVQDWWWLEAPPTRCLVIHASLSVIAGNPAWGRAPGLIGVENIA